VAISTICIIVENSIFEEERSKQYYFEINMKSSADSFAQLYYNVGNGLSEKNSTIQHVKKRTGFKRIKFIVPKKKIYCFRFDPSQTSGSIIIKGIRIINRFSGEIMDITLNSLKSFNQINNLELKDGLLHITNDQKSNGPIFYFEVDYPITYSFIKKTASLFYYEIKKFIIILTLSFTAIFLLFYH
jgi:hypothetical protein